MLSVAPQPAPKPLPAEVVRMARLMVQQHTRVPLPPPLPPAARKHLFYCDKVDVKPNTIRLRQYNPSIYFPQSFRTIQLGVDSGVQAIIARRLHPRKR